jgi:hypothetical protein
LELNMGSRTLGFVIVSTVVLAAAAAAPSAQAESSAAGWAVYRDAQGTSVQYPRDVFSEQQEPTEQEPGRVFATEDGRARFHVFSLPNPNALSPGAFMRANFPASRSTLTYDRVSSNFFALSTRRDGMIVYLRCNFASGRSGTLHCVDIRYPISEKRDWDGIVTRISRSLRPLASAR